MTRANRHRDRSARSRAPAAAAPLPAPTLGSRPRADWVWLGSGALAILVLLATCRGYTRGVPVADDYAFLARLAFRPLDWFDSMGATYYWRPLSRQLYFSALGRTLFEAPWRSALMNVAVLLVTYVALWRIARRGFGAPVATAIAVFPLLSEPARALLAWPSGAQHLLAGMFAAVALHEAFGAHVITALAAAGLGMLCHESGVLALAAVPALAWWQVRGQAATVRSDLARMRRHAGIATLGALATLALWTWGYLTARAHGVALPPRAAGVVPVGQMADLIARAIPAALNLEDLAPVPRTTLEIGYVLVAALALIRIIARPARARIGRAAVALAAGLAWFALGALPLAQLLPDWNAWRAWLPTLGLGLGLGTALAFVHPALAISLVGLRLVALLLAPLGPATVAITAPATGSHMSYVRLVRLQRTVESTRHALKAAYPKLSSGAAVKFWNLPQLAEVGFQGSAALGVWYGDSSLSWSRFGGAGAIGQNVDALVEYRDFTAVPAQVLEPEAFESYFRAGLAMIDGRMDEAEAELERTERATGTRGPLYASVAFNRAWIAIGNGNANRADSLLRVSHEFGQKKDADYWALAARIALVRNDRPGAISAVERCLALDPRNARGLEIVQFLRETTAVDPRRRPRPQQTR